MKKFNHKKLVVLLSLIGLVANATPLLAWTIDLEILGGSYKIETATEINFPAITASSGDTVSTLDFSTLNSALNYLQITDENGNNPFDVTVSSTQLKHFDNYSSELNVAESSGNLIKVASTTGLAVSDTVQINSTGQIYTVTDVVDATSFHVTPDLSNLPASGTVNSIVDCDYTPKKCISLNDLKIMSSPATIVNGSADGIETLPFETYQTFGGETSTTADSIGNTLNVVDPDVFHVGESIDLIMSDKTTKYSYTVTSINETSLSIDNSVPSNLETGLKVRSTTSRSVTLAKGHGGETGKYKIFPKIQANIRAGQKPGQYVSVLYLSIF